VDGRNHHQGASHSVGAALIAAVAAAGLARLMGWARPIAIGLAVAGGWLSHVVLDLFGNDTHPPIGLMALWPFDRGYFKSPWIVFMDIGRTLDWATVRHDAIAVSWELVALAPLLAAVWWLARRRALGKRV
jgi:membrane-bound metal-dependent hydrolase YbcI (DUF457 family)